MKTAFISGHRDVTEEEFQEHYTPLILAAVKAGHNFVVGDCEGVDYRSQLELFSANATDKLTVFHMYKSPRWRAVETVKTRGGYTSDNARDSAMTEASDYDIAWVRPGKEKSGTAKNLARRRK